MILLKGKKKLLKKLNFNKNILQYLQGLMKSLPRQGGDVGTYLKIVT